MRKSSPLTDEMEKSGRVGIIGAGGLIGISLIILQDLLAIASLDVPQFISLVAFSISIPILTCHIILKQYEIIYRCIIYFWFNIALFFLPTGFCLTIIGVNAAIWHVSWIVGLVFLSASVIALLFFLGYFMEEDFNYKFDGVSGNKTTDAEESKK